MRKGLKLPEHCHSFWENTHVDVMQPSSRENPREEPVYGEQLRWQNDWTPANRTKSKERRQELDNSRGQKKDKGTNYDQS